MFVVWDWRRSGASFSWYRGVNERIPAPVLSQRFEVHRNFGAPPLHDFCSLFDFCQNMKYYVKCCQSMPKYAKVCQKCQLCQIVPIMPNFAEFCRIMPNYATLCHIMPKFGLGYCCGIYFFGFRRWRILNFSVLVIWHFWVCSFSVESFRCWGNLEIYLIISLRGHQIKLPRQVR